MKIKVLFLLLFAVICVNSFSQLRLGLRAGLSSSTIKADDFTTSDGRYQVESVSNARVGLQGGLIAQIILGGFFLQPEFLLVYSGGDIRVKDIQQGTNVINTQRFTKLDIPVLVGAKIGPLHVGAGPVASIILSKPSEAFNFSEANVNSKYKNATFGFQAGAGFDLGKITLDLKYEGNLSKLGNGMNIGGENYTFDSRNRQWILAVGLFF